MENRLEQNITTNDDITLKELVAKAKLISQYLFSKWIIIAGCVILGIISGLSYAYLKKATYTATSTFVLEESGGGSPLGEYAGLASAVGIGGLSDGGGGLFQGENILELYKSRSMLSQALLSKINSNGDSLLIDEYIKFNKLKDKWKGNAQLQDISFIKKGNQGFTRVQDSLISTFVNDINKNYLSVSKIDKKLAIIKVDVKAKNELFAKIFNDQIVKTVNDFYIQTKTKKSLANVAVLEHQTDSVRQVLNGAINTTANVTDATPNLNPTRQILRAPAQRSQFNADASKAVLTQLIQNLELSKLSLRKETPLIQIIDTPIFPLEKERLGKIKGGIIGGTIFGIIALILLTFKKILMDLNL